MDATLKARICDRLINDIDTLPPLLQGAAKYIVGNPNDFGLDPIRTSARKIGISANSLVRLAHHLGFDTFDELREPFRKSLVEQSKLGPADNWVDRLSDTSAFGESQASIVRNEISIVNRSLQLLTPELVEDVLTLILNARTVYVTANRASYAMAYYFHYVGRMILPSLRLNPRDMGGLVDEMLGADENDVLLAITFSPYSAETIKALRLAKSQKTKVIIISDSELIAPGIKADVMLKVSAHSTHHFGCYAGVLAVLDCLLAQLARMGGAESARRIASYQTLRDDFDEYWKAKMPRVQK